MQSKRGLADDLAKHLGAIVVRERNRLGLRQDELALAAGVSTRVVHQIENGKGTSRLDSIVAVLSVLGLTLEVTPEDGGHGGGSA
jgi:y4mF family transcriptional regulator